jgi:hypothetical protein
MNKIFFVESKSYLHAEPAQAVAILPPKERWLASPTENRSAPTGFHKKIIFFYAAVYRRLATSPAAKATATSGNGPSCCMAAPKP